MTLQLQGIAPPSLLTLQGAVGREQRACEERGYKGLHAFPSNITRDAPPITRDYPPLPSNITREVTHRLSFCMQRVADCLLCQALGRDLCVDRLARADERPSRLAM